MTDALGLGFVTEDTVRQLSGTFEEPKWLLEERLDALRRYEALPVETNQLFKTYVDLRAARFGEIEPYAEIGDAAAIDTRVPDGASALLHISEDRVVARAMSVEAKSAGVVVDTISSVLRDHENLLRSTLQGGATLPPHDKFAQLTRATASTGLVVYVPDGVEIAQPIVLRAGIGEPGRGLVARTLVILGRGAHARLLEEQLDSREPAGSVETSRSDESAVSVESDAQSRQSLWAGTMEVLLAEGATLDVASEENFGANTISLMNRHATIGKGAGLRWALATVGGQLVKSRIDNQLVGDGASVRQVEIAFGGGSQLFDLTNYTRHLAADTTGDLLSKGVFQDRSRGYFKGISSIEKVAPGTDSFLGQFAMLLGKRARSVAIPSLEIDQPNVRRASHSSSVGPIDETQIFYVMSRGFPREVARKAIVLGFLEPVVARIPLPDAQERLRELLDRKWGAVDKPSDSKAA